MDKSRDKHELANYVIKNKEAHYRLAYSYVKNTEDALDIVQESIFKALSSIDSLENPSFIKTWYYRILVHTSLDFLRKHKKIISVQHEFFSNIDLGAFDNYENFDLKKAMEDLPVEYQSLIILRYFEDLKIDEIAKIFNQNVNTVKTHIHKVLGLLRIKMDD